MPFTPFKRWALAGLLAMAAASPALAEWRGLPYADIAKMPLGLKMVDPQNVYTCFYVARPGQGQGALPAGLRFQVRKGNELIPIPVQASGRLDLPLRQDWADAGAKLEVNQPKGAIRLALNMNPRVPPGRRMSYATLTESATVLERGVKQMAGMFSLMAPKVSAFLLEFPAGAAQSATLVWPDGHKQVWKSDSKGQISLPWNADWAGATVELSADLVRVEPKL